MVTLEKMVQLFKSEIDNFFEKEHNVYEEEEFCRVMFIRIDSLLVVKEQKSIYESRARYEQWRDLYACLKSKDKGFKVNL